MKERVYITLHGYKRPDWDDFHAMKKNIDMPGEVIIFNYYDSTKKELIDKKIWWDNIKSKMDEYKDHPITIIGYSVGAVAGIAVSSLYENVDEIYAITPAVKTKFLPWIIKAHFLKWKQS